MKCPSVVSVEKCFSRLDMDEFVAELTRLCPVTRSEMFKKASITNASPLLRLRAHRVWYVCQVIAVSAFLSELRLSRRNLSFIYYCKSSALEFSLFGLLIILDIGRERGGENTFGGVGEAGVAFPSGMGHLPLSRAVSHFSLDGERPCTCIYSITVSFQVACVNRRRWS